MHNQPHIPFCFVSWYCVCFLPGHRGLVPVLLLSDDSNLSEKKYFLMMQENICILMCPNVALFNTLAEHAGDEIASQRRSYSSISPHHNHIRWYFIFAPPSLSVVSGDMIHRICFHFSLQELTQSNEYLNAGVQICYTCNLCQVSRAALERSSRLHLHSRPKAPHGMTAAMTTANLK